MKALEIAEPFGIDALRIVTRPDPEPGPGQVVLRARAWSLNYRDLLVVGGRWRAPGPRVPFSDVVGSVVAIGDGVTRVALGDRVSPIFYPRWIDGPIDEDKGRAAPGGRAFDGFGSELVVVDAEAVTHVPEHLDDVEAATLPTAGVTAWNAVVASGGTEAGEAVAVTGTGGVSLLALQVAALRGARVVVTSGSDPKLERAHALGATAGVNHRTSDWSQEVRRLTDGGADLVVDTVGDLDASVRAVRIGGAVSFVGFLRGSSASVDLVGLMGQSARIQAIDVGSRRMLEELCAALSAHRVKPVVDRVFGFEEAAEALRYLASGQHFGKVGLGI